MIDKSVLLAKLNVPLIITNALHFFALYNPIFLGCQVRTSVHHTRLVKPNVKQPSSLNNEELIRSVCAVLSTWNTRLLLAGAGRV